jgi:hypothetical protein
MTVRSLLTFWFLILISAVSFSQNKVSKKLKLEMFVKDGSFNLNDSIIVEAHLTNKSKSAILIPANFYLRSNLYPNGVGGAVATNAIFNFRLGAKSDVDSWFVENLLFVEAKEFIKLQPGETQKFRIDLGSHITSYNLEPLSKKKIETGMEYMLLLEYYCFSERNKELFRGKAKSKEKKIIFY